MTNQIKSTLKDVPETMLWTLYNRATEAKRTDSIIKDDKCVEIFESIKYDYSKSFGKAEPSHAVRSLLFDLEIKEFLSQNPKGTIVNLGEGLETQRFRIDESEAFWISVDLPEAIEIREQFITPTKRHIHSPLSVLDRKWFDWVPKNEPVFITAQGLFMYLPEHELKSLIQDMFSTFQEGYLMFDTIPKWLSNKTMSEKGWQKTSFYTTPQMPWGINRNQVSLLKKWSPKIDIIEEVLYEFPRGAQKWFFKLALSAPILKNYVPTGIKIKFKNS
jgi:O-methyltransferase involved in polyketide biosynthesis